MSNRTAENRSTPVESPGRSVTALLRSPRMAGLLLLIPAAILLLPTLVFPLGPDQGMFFVSAQKILAGAALYRDMVDVKPPLIYHIYAVGIALFGPTEWSIRIVDLLVQIATCWLIIRLCRRHSSSLATPLIASISYALLYVSLGSNGTAQTESYTGILGLSAWMISTGALRRRRFLPAGILCGALFLLKFTLGAMLGILLVSEFILAGDRAAVAIRNAAMTVSGFVIAASVLPLYLLLFDAWSQYSLLQEFMSGYVMLQFGSIGSAFSVMYREVTVIIPRNYSIALLVATATGIGATLRGPGIDEPRRRDLWRLLSFCTLAIAVYALTIVLEGKYFGYHFMRLYPFAVILAGFGVEAVASRRLALWPLRGRAAILFGMLSLLLLFLSPVAHYLWQATPFALWVAEGDTAVDLFYSRDTTLYPRESLKLVGAYLRSNLKPGEKLVVLGSSATLVYYQAHYLPDIPIYHSAFLLAPFAPEEWRRFVGGYMVRERPRFIVVEEGDLHPLQTGTQETSIDLLRTLPGVDSLVRGSYRREMYSGCYLVLERTDTSPPSGGG